MSEPWPEEFSVARSAPSSCSSDMGSRNGRSSSASLRGLFICAMRSSSSSCLVHLAFHCRAR
eukprot:7475351-Pyramimonas_sp.AAC.1